MTILLKVKTFIVFYFVPTFAVHAKRTNTTTVYSSESSSERLADEFLRDGTIITDESSPIKTETIDFVKLRDKDANNRVMLLGDFFTSGKIANAVVTGETSGILPNLSTQKKVLKRS